MVDPINLMRCAAPWRIAELGDARSPQKTDDAPDDPT
jgi:hypothetical protein